VRREGGQGREERRMDRGEKREGEEDKYTVVYFCRVGLFL
jgi:hypothetical protein